MFVLCTFMFIFFFGNYIWLYCGEYSGILGKQSPLLCCAYLMHSCYALCVLLGFGMFFGSTRSSSSSYHSWHHKNQWILLIAKLLIVYHISGPTENYSYLAEDIFEEIEWSWVMLRCFEMKRACSLLECLRSIFLGCTREIEQVNIMMCKLYYNKKLEASSGYRVHYCTE